MTLASVDLPTLTIQVSNIIAGRVLVSITSDADISALVDDWNVETLALVYKPIFVQQVNANTVQMTFMALTWTKLALKRSSSGSFMGTNLLTYLETATSAFGASHEEQSLAPMFVGMGAFLSALAVGIGIATH